MINRAECFCLGKVVRKYSFKGSVVVKLDIKDSQFYETIKFVFLERDEDLVPFFIREILPQKINEFRILFDSVNTEKDAEMILGSHVYLPLDLLSVSERESSRLREIVGFLAIDIAYGEIGCIKRINEKSRQPLFEIDNGGKQVLVPMVDKFIEEIDYENKRVIFKTPPGLIALYL